MSVLHCHISSFTASSGFRGPAPGAATRLSPHTHA
jgi:hypothetical protein